MAPAVAKRKIVRARRRLSGWTVAFAFGYRPAMPIVATVMNSTTGEPIQRFTFGRMPKPWVSFILETGERVTADRVDIGKPAPGKVVVPVSVWVTPKTEPA